jgi:hypothetical protein
MPAPPKRLKELIEATVDHHAPLTYPDLQEVTIRWRGSYGYMDAWAGEGEDNDEQIPLCRIPGGLPPPAVQIAAQPLDLAARTVGEHADRAHTDHDLAGGWTMWATSIQPPARLMSTSFTHRSHSGLHAKLLEWRFRGSYEFAPYIYRQQ